MLNSPVAIDSKLPWVGTTIFTVMSKLAADCGAINLSQGFPDFQADPSLFDAVHRAMLAGRNQYAPMAGTAELRQGIASKVAALYGIRYDVDTEVTVTAGPTQAILTAIAAFVRPGVEVTVFEPVYDSYVPAIERGLDNDLELREQPFVALGEGEAQQRRGDILREHDDASARTRAHGAAAQVELPEAAGVETRFVHSRPSV